MHQAGISLYPDMAEEAALEAYIERAAAAGCQRAFLSLILESLHFAGARRPDAPVFMRAVRACAVRNLSVWCDLNDAAIETFGGLDAALNRLADMGVCGVRIDSGLSIEALAAVSRHESGLGLQLNCAALRPDRPQTISLAQKLLERIEREGDPKRIEACFNFYPRCGTGISEQAVAAACGWLRARGVRVSAFVASRAAPSMLHAPSRGVPTVETLRYAAPYTAARILTFLGVDDVLFGDGFASEEELSELAVALSDTPTRLRVRFFDWVPKDVIRALRQIVFRNREDEPVDLLRGTAARGILLEPRETRPGTRGEVTMDNTLSAQYAGELQILLSDLPAQPFANVVGRVREDDEPLLAYLRDASRSYMIETDCKE